MYIVHEIENGRTAQSTLYGLHQLARHLHILDEFVAILVTRLPHAVHVNNGVNERIQDHNAGSNRCWYPIVWRNIIIGSSLRACSHHNHFARSNWEANEQNEIGIRCLPSLGWPKYMYFSPLTDGMGTAALVASRNAYTEYVKTAKDECDGHR